MDVLRRPSYGTRTLAYHGNGLSFIEGSAKRHEIRHVHRSRWDPASSPKPMTLPNRQGEPGWDIAISSRGLLKLSRNGNLWLLDGGTWKKTGALTHSFTLIGDMLYKVNRKDFSLWATNLATGGSWDRIGDATHSVQVPKHGPVRTVARVDGFLHRIRKSELAIELYGGASGMWKPIGWRARAIDAVGSTLHAIGLTHILMASR